MIANVAEYQKVVQMVETALECLNSLRFGSHWLLMNYLQQQHGIKTLDSLDAIKKAQRLCDEFLTAYTAEDE